MSKGNMVPIIYSPGFGAGWSSCGSDGMAFDRELASAIESGDKVEINRIADKNWPEEYKGGLDDCVVKWVEKGTNFKIYEYDGNESITFQDSDIWNSAK